MASLRELQRCFAAAVRDPDSACAVLPPENLSVYRNNAASGFRSALQRTFPVVRRRVGDDYFRQLSAHYRERFPSRSGDLHWAGRDFAAFLDEYLAGGDYAWLADLARLEWSRHECSVLAESPPAGAEQLARFAASELEHLVLEFQPSLRLHTSSYPVFSIWQANQVENAPPVDQSLGSESGMVRIRNDLPEVRGLEPGLFSFLAALHGGDSLGDAMGHAGLDENALTHAMALLFREELVTSISLRAAREVV
jgi:hypothetical protein